MSGLRIVEPIANVRCGCSDHPGRFASATRQPGRHVLLECSPQIDEESAATTRR